MTNAFYKNLLVIFSVGFALGLNGCTYITQGIPKDDRGALFISNENLGGISISSDDLGESNPVIVYPEQNWGSADSLWFYNTTQGSNLMDYNIFLGLEQENSEQLFRDNHNIAKYGYLAQKPSKDNKDGLPVGFVKDYYRGNDYVGFTCAACHTTQINYSNGQQTIGIRIDGGPAMADMQTMMEHLAKALTKNLNDEHKFNRLAARIGADSSIKKKKQLQEILRRDADNLTKYVSDNKPLLSAPHKGEADYGYGRLDAFGRIYNRVMSHISRDTFQPNPPNAPVSYPFLWDTPQHDFVQWNGVGDNRSSFGLGPLARNAGEVIGVFATFDVTKQNGDAKTFIPSSVPLVNMLRLETAVSKLWSPSWRQLAKDGYLPQLDEKLVTTGKDVYAEYKCAACHDNVGKGGFEREDPERLVTAQFSSLDMIGTDPQMASNAIAYCGKSGAYINKDLGFCLGEIENTQKIPVLGAVSAVTAGVVAMKGLTHLNHVLREAINNPYTNTKTERHVDLEIANRGYLNAYKARPLNGIWATAPYLHNGSVPNLYELFLPSCHGADITAEKKCRSNTFTVGSRELDVAKVGFIQADPNDYPDLFVFDTSIPGNSNKGHEYTTGATKMPKLDENGFVVREGGNIVTERFAPMTDNKRLALVEYLKSL